MISPTKQEAEYGNPQNDNAEIIKVSKSVAILLAVAESLSRLSLISLKAGNRMQFLISRSWAR